VLEVDLPRELRAAADGTSTAPDASSSPRPTADPERAPDRPSARPGTGRIGASDAPWGWWAAGALGLGVLVVVLLLLAQRRRR
jgi:hypothetical protein